MQWCDDVVVVGNEEWIVVVDVFWLLRFVNFVRNFEFYGFITKFGDLEFIGDQLKYKIFGTYFNMLRIICQISHI